MEEEKRKAYSEVVEILKLIEDEQKLERIPFEVIELIKRNSDPTYKPEISREKPLEEQNLRNETYAILSWIASKYWEEEFKEANIEEPSTVKTTMLENEETNIEMTTEEISGQEGIERISESNTENISVYNDIEPEAMEPKENLPILVSDLKWYQRIKAQIIKFFKTLFKLNKGEAREGVN